MAKKTIYMDSELPIYSDIVNDTKAWEEIEKLAVETFSQNHNGKAEKALSNKASGRNCPKCASTLRVKEVSDNGVLVVICWNCHSTWHNSDLDAVYEVDEKGKTIIDAVTDGMWRRIPDDTVNHWMKYFNTYKEKA